MWCETDKAGNTLVRTWIWPEPASVKHIYTMPHTHTYTLHMLDDLEYRRHLPEMYLVWCVCVWWAESGGKICWSKSKNNKAAKQTVNHSQCQCKWKKKKPNDFNGNDDDDDDKIATTVSAATPLATAPLTDRSVYIIRLWSHNINIVLHIWYLICHAATEKIHTKLRLHRDWTGNTGYCSIRFNDSK